MAEIIRMQTSDGDGIELVKYEDFIFPNEENIDPESLLHYARNFKYRSEDILVCSYPKCGFHMLNNMLWRLKTFDSSKRPGDTVLEVGPPEMIESQDDPRIIFTELRPHRLPKDHIEQGGKMILLLRNPKDVLVSDYHYLKTIKLVQNKQTWDEFFRSAISGVVPYGSYIDHLGVWEKVIKDRPKGFENMEVFYYEDFQTDRQATLQRLNLCLGFNRDQAYLDRVLEETTLKSLRVQDNTFRRDKVNDYCRADDGGTAIYRKGIIGDWKYLLTVAQSEIVDGLMKETLQEGIFHFNYGD